MTDSVEPDEGSSAEDFYWNQARDSLLTPTAIKLFQIAAGHDGEEFDSARTEIDAEYATLQGQGSDRHGGKFQTAVQVYKEAGWLTLEDGKLTVTPVGRQALQLLASSPDFLKAVPYFLVELLARFQLNNPARPPVRDDEIADLREASNVFPYWTIWKIMRECDNRISVEELRRFVFRLHRSEDIDETIQQIRAFRSDKQSLTPEQIDSKYPPVLEGANGEPKYWMGRAGRHIGSLPKLITKDGASTFVLNENYLPLIDGVLANEPVFKDYLTEETWMAKHGQPIDLEKADVEVESFKDPQITDLLEDEDEVARQVEELIAAGSRSFLLVGPPGTSKSWYARQLANRIVGQDMSRVRLVQFHSSFGYEDFIEGFVPEVKEGSELPTFIRKWKVFAKVCELARGGDFAVLIVDEFSRGDAGRIFGEALTYIEPDYRDTPFQLASGRSFTVPESLIIIGTMNPYDRSVSAVDVAMQRRFDIIRMVPNEEILRRILDGNEMEQELVERVVTFFRICQEAMPHGGLGHAYFLRASDVASLERIWKFNLAPLIDQELQFEPSAHTRIENAFHVMIDK